MTDLEELMTELKELEEMFDEEQIKEAMVELHLCHFCHRKMEDVEMSIKHCTRCDAYKVTSVACSSGWEFFFERVYKEGTYRFSYEVDNNIFIVNKKEDWWGYGDRGLVCKTDDIYSVTPQNWSQKLPTILTFS